MRNVWRKYAAGKILYSSKWRIGPLLILCVAVLVACVSQRFSVESACQRNVELRGELEELRGSVSRSRADVFRLVSRERIETIARSEFDLVPPAFGDQVFLPEWRDGTPRRGVGGMIAATLVSIAGDGVSSLFHSTGLANAENLEIGRER